MTLHIEPGTDVKGGQYHGRGEDRYREFRCIAPRLCHDAFIHYNGGILLVVRDNEPAKGKLWPIGGAMDKFVSEEESLINLVKRESGLDLSDIRYLGKDRMWWKTDPYGGNRGVDDFAFAYFGRGEGEITLDNLHKDPRIVTPKEYGWIRNDLHQYVQTFMDMSIKLIE